MLPVITDLVAIQQTGMTSCYSIGVRPNKGTKRDIGSSVPSDTHNDLPVGI